MLSFRVFYKNAFDIFKNFNKAQKNFKNDTFLLSVAGFDSVHVPRHLPLYKSNVAFNIRVSACCRQIM